MSSLKIFIALLLLLSKVRISTHTVVWSRWAVALEHMRMIESQSQELTLLKGYKYNFPMVNRELVPYPRGGPQLIRGVLSEASSYKRVAYKSLGWVQLYSSVSWLAMWAFSGLHCLLLYDDLYNLRTLPAKMPSPDAEPMEPPLDLGLWTYKIISQNKPSLLIKLASLRYLIVIMKKWIH